MNRFLGLSALVLLAGAGCRMCACPYDYCGPVVECGCVGCGGEDGGVMPPDGPYQENNAPGNGEVISPAPQAAPAPVSAPTSYNGTNWRRTGPTLASR